MQPKKLSLWELADYVSFPAVSGTVVTSFVVCSYVLFDIKKEIIHPLLYIISLSLTTSAIPQEWKLAQCVPVFKGGDIKELDNYKPISVLPVFSNILEKAVHNQLYEYPESSKFLSSQQFGFRRNRSTSSAVVYFSDTVGKTWTRANLQVHCL